MMVRTKGHDGGTAPDSVVIDHNGAEWAYSLGLKERLVPHMYEGKPVGNPYQPRTAHWYYFRHGQAGGDFVYPMTTPTRTRQLRKVKTTMVRAVNPVRTTSAYRISTRRYSP